MNKITIFLLASLLAGCSTNFKDMTQFEHLYQFEGLKKPCSSDRNCKLADRRYVKCGGRDVFVYSSLVINGNDEKHLLALSEQNMSVHQGGLEECVGGPPPPRGICWKNQCEIIYTWRK